MRKFTLNLMAGLIFTSGIFMLSCNKDDNKDTVKDVDGNTYNTVKIGDQTWMVENLKTTALNDGTKIPNVTDGNQWAGLSTPGYCWYDNQVSNKEAYGALYNWFAVNTGKLCPQGWRVATDQDWVDLELQLGLQSIEKDLLAWRGEVENVGGKFKETGTTHWKSPNTGATNVAGFTALPGGNRSLYGHFEYLNEYGYWWCSVAPDETYGIGRSLGYNITSIMKSKFNRPLGFSVRCIEE